MFDENKYLTLLKNIVLTCLNDANVNVYLFGSWARKEEKKTSDIDLAVEWIGKVDKSKMSQLREKIEESRVPYFVDVVDLTEASPILVKRIRQEGILWKG
jgi:uncharacterized protein